VDVRIGIIQGAKELDIDFPSETTQEQIHTQVEEAIAAGESVVWFTDRRGRQVGVIASRIAYIEIGAQDEVRKVGFGAS
jgi:hypothetical protein